MITHEIDVTGASADDLKKAQGDWNRRQAPAQEPSVPTHALIKPLHGMVLCRVVDERPRDKNGNVRVSPTSKLILPDTVHVRPDTAKVLAASEGVRTSDGALIEPGVVPGDLVIFNPYAVTRVLDNGGDLANAAGSPFAGSGDRFLIAQNQILGKVL